MRTVGEIGAVLRRHFRRTVVAAAALVAIAVTLLLVLVFDEDPAPPARHDISSNFKVCVLDATQGDDSAKTVWNAVRSTAEKAPINTQHLVVPAGSGVDPAPYLNSLIELDCQLVVTSGAELAETLKAVATNNPDTRFLNIGAPVDLPNVRTIPVSEATSTMISDEVLSAARR
jgi:basic membrane lipoprotein Med (substrate-binding protein (PBP1-ABC) superfamily)